LDLFRGEKSINGSGGVVILDVSVVSWCNSGEINPENPNIAAYLAIKRLDLPSKHRRVGDINWRRLPSNQVFSLWH